MAGLVPAIHVYSDRPAESRGCQAQSRVWRRDV